MARRILAALVVMGVVLTFTPARLSGEPTTTSVRPTLRTPALTSLKPNPHVVYPRRPGAKYEDIEAPPHGRVTLAETLSILRSTIEPRTTLPRHWNPANANDAKQRGLADGYTPVSTDTAGDVLHVVVREKDGIGSIPLSCSATAASDGTVLIPYDDGDQPPLPVLQPATTAAGRPKPVNSDLDLYLPLGGRRGRIYLACAQLSLLGLRLGVATRAVWAIDV